DDEIAARLAISRGELDKLAKDANAVSLVSLSRKFYDDDSSREMEEIDILEDHRTEDPIQELQRRDLYQLIMNGLSRIERIILLLYYFEEMTMKEIGVTLDLSESRVSQMHSSILTRLLQQMNRRGQLQYDR
ncbi:MAG: sigma-70 family RNA polymerase sigma factor, partial [Phycisphaerae bacterium]|nr:sigma-70 family RNA polymerase sigma factor [Phycisphaerae bacterium]